MKYLKVKKGGVLVKRPQGNHHYEDDIVFNPQLIVDDIIPEDTGLVDCDGNRIVKVHEWGFHQDNQEAEPFSGGEVKFP